MSCSTKEGPRVFIEFAEAMTGEKITQAEWHEIRSRAAAAGADVSRSRVSREENMDAARRLSTSLLDSSYVTREELDDYLMSTEDLVHFAGESSNTRGTIAAVEFLSANGVKETLADIRSEASSVEGKDSSFESGSGTSLLSQTPLEYADKEWAGKVVWANVSADERESFAWAMDSFVLGQVAPSLGDSEDYESYPDPDAAATAARILNSFPLETDNKTVVDAFEKSWLSDYMFADDGEPFSDALWEEWKANGPE